MNEQDSFLKDLEPKEETLLDQPIVEETKEKPEIKEEDDEIKLRNRRERRLSEKLQAERESSIRLAERLATLTEAQKFKNEAGDDYLKSVEKIYGTDSPESTAATELLKTALKAVEEKATTRALEQFREEQRQSRAEMSKAEQELDSMIDEIEDENDIVMTETQKKGFFTMLEKMSPKDRDGNVTQYADHHSVWDIYKSKLTQNNDRAKDLASRSMVQSGSSPKTKVEDDALARILRDNGII